LNEVAQQRQQVFVTSSMQCQLSRHRVWRSSVTIW